MCGEYAVDRFRENAKMRTESGLGDDMNIDWRPLVSEAMS